MQTFLPYPSFVDSAKCLDYRRLGKQRVECKQILQALTKGTRWANHPATKMWAGHLHALCEYAVVVCDEWHNRGYTDNLADYFCDYIDDHPGLDDSYPSFVGNKEFHRSHQSNLLRKLPFHYSKFGWDVPDDLPYVWPV